MPLKKGMFPHTIITDTQGCGAVLADTKLSPFIDITLFDTETQKTKVSTYISIDHNESPSLTCILYSSPYICTLHTYLQ